MIFFDLDDTLADHSHAVCSTLATVRDTHQAFAAYSPPALEQEYHRLLEDIHPRVLSGELTQEEARTERFRRLLNCDVDEAAEVAARYRAVYQQNRRPVPGAIQLLELLSEQARIGIITNNLTAEQEDTLRYCRLTHLVDLLVTSEEAGAPKPNPAIFHTALARSGCRPGDAVMVGDSWENDVQGALAVGMRAVWLNRRGRPHPNPDVAAQITSLEPVEPLLALLLPA